MVWKAAQKTFRHWKILRGDKVMVTTGKDKGQTGVVTAVVRTRNRAFVEGLNLVKKHVKAPPGADKSQGGIVTMESPIHISNLSLLDPVTGAPCRAAFKYSEDGTKVRVSRGPSASGQIIPPAAILKERRQPRPTDGSQVGPLDTLPEQAHKKTYEHGKMSEDVGLPPVHIVNGRWELDVSRMGRLVPFPAPVKMPFRPSKTSVEAGSTSTGEKDSPSVS